MLSHRFAKTADNRLLANNRWHLNSLSSDDGARREDRRLNSLSSDGARRVEDRRLLGLHRC